MKRYAWIIFFLWAAAIAYGQGFTNGGFDNGQGGGSGNGGGWTLNAGNSTTTNNVGIGSTNPRSALDVQGTITASSFQSTGSGPSYTLSNLGVGTATPQQALDVQGTVRTGGLTLTTVASGTQCLHANSSGIVTGTGSDCGAGSSGLWTTINTNDVYENNSGTFGNVGIGTSLTTGGRLVITGGNVGIGSTAPGKLLDVQGTARAINFTASGTGPNFFGTNVGIGSANPVVALDVQGSVKISGLTAGKSLCARANNTVGNCTSVVAADGTCTCP